MTAGRRLASGAHGPVRSDRDPRGASPSARPRTVGHMERPRAPRRRGVTAAAAALAVAELAAALTRAVPSPTAAVADVAVARLPGRLAAALLGVLRGAARPLTLVVVVLAVLAVGAFAGRFHGDAGGRLGREGTDRIARALLVGLTVALGAAAQLAQRGTATLPTLVVACGAALVGVGVLELAPRRGRASRGDGADPVAAAELGVALPDEPDRADTLRDASPLLDRRQVLVAGLGLAIVAAGALVGRTVDRVRTLVRLPAVPRPLPAITAAQDLASAIDGLSPVLTPVADFYRIDTALTIPQVDVAGWRLAITGRVAREVRLTFDELIDLGLVEVDATIACVSNEVGGGLIGTARWTGVPLTRVLELAGPRTDAEQLVGRSVDGWTAGFPLAVLDDGREALVAVGMQGEPLPARNGAPARLVVPGLYGYVSATKWLAELEVTGWDAFDAYWVPRGWAKEAPIKASSRIDVPRDGASVEAGEVEVAGVAWAPNVGVGTVEVAVDDGPWRPATLASPLSAATWVQWRTSVPLAAGTHVLAVRVLDAEGRPQAEGPRPVLPDGAEGYHRRQVTVA